MARRDVDRFVLGRPALVCRWRLAAGGLPLQGRHLRALARRRLGGSPVSPALVGWAQQHVEWTLEKGSAAHPDGVLMLVVDEAGRAAMTVGPYEPLDSRDVAALAARAALSRTEAATTGVAPETLWVVAGDALLVDAALGEQLAGVASLVRDLSAHMGLRVERAPGLVGRLGEARRLAAAGAPLPARDTGAEGIFLASDEHGVVVAADAPSPRAERFVASYGKLLSTFGDRRG